jgi:hypothetical protein
MGAKFHRAAHRHGRRVGGGKRCEDIARRTITSSLTSPPAIPRLYPIFACSHVSSLATFCPLGVGKESLDSPAGWSCRRPRHLTKEPAARAPGWKAPKGLKSNPSPRSIPVTILTAHVISGEGRRAPKGGRGRIRDEALSPRRSFYDICQLRVGRLGSMPGRGLFAHHSHRGCRALSIRAAGLVSQSKHREHAGRRNRRPRYSINSPEKTPASQRAL